jgi:hypothetical protein
MFTRFNRAEDDEDERGKEEIFENKNPLKFSP